MRKFLFSAILAAMCCGCLISCNEKPQDYRLVKVMPDGKEVVEQLEATNDTDAVKKFFALMEKMIFEQQQTDVKSMYVVSPKGDTLNKDEALMEAVLKPTVIPADVEEVDSADTAK